MKKKVLFAATVVKTHIMEFHLPYLKMLQEMGWETSVAAKNDYEDPDSCVIPFCDSYYDVPFARSPLNKANLRAYRMLKKLIDREHYDMIHCHTPVGAILTRLAARKARKNGTKVIYTAHGFHFFKGAPLLNWLIYFPAEWLCSFMTDVLITINKEDYAFARKHMHAARICYVPGVGVDTGRFGGYGRERDSVRERVGMRPEEFLLLSVGELTPNKNHEMVIRAMKLLEDTNVRYVIAGRGQRMEELKILVQNLNLQDRVTLLGYCDFVGPLCAAADAFIFPSFREGLSVALMEAMSARLPCIVGRIRGNTDLIAGGAEGLYTALTPEAMAEKIRMLYENPELRKKLGTAAGEKVKQFDLKNVLNTVKEIYLEETQ